VSSHYGHLQQIKYKLIIIVTMLECKTVTLRTRPLKNGMLSYYLDYYPGYRDQETMKSIRHEGLNIYIYANPKNERERNFNATMSEKAEAIRCRRFESIVNDRYDFFDRHKLKADFLEYYRRQLRKHDQKWEFVYHHFYNFVHGKCTFEEIDIDLCNKFREYLLNAKQLRRDGRISKNSASGYWSTFRGLLKILYRNQLIKTNINDFLDKIETEDTPKDYLSVEELYKLAETPCKKPILKTAALFSCLTSLRISDILSLQWHEIVDFAAGGKCVHTITQKTKTEDIIPISDEALQLIGYSPEKTGLVFKGLKRSWTQHPMKEWIRKAGITKNITFHSYRRTYATLQGAAGTDIRTIQSNMAHKSITTTQRYMKVVDSNKREASNRISLIRK
jgi:integrase